MKIIPAVLAVLTELRRTYTRYPTPFHSIHEAVGFLEIEVHGLRTAVAQQTRTRLAQAEAEQASTVLAAMSLRLLIDLVREGCGACSDHTCEEHPAQDQPGDFGLLPETWLAQRFMGGDAVENDRVRTALVKLGSKST